MPSRLVFLSAQYLVSVNCGHELAALRHQPGRALFLVYTTQLTPDGEVLKPPPEAVAALRREVPPRAQGSSFIQSFIVVGHCFAMAASATHIWNSVPFEVAWIHPY